MYHHFIMFVYRTNQVATFLASRERNSCGREFRPGRVEFGTVNAGVRRQVLRLFLRGGGREGLVRVTTTVH